MIKNGALLFLVFLISRVSLAQQDPLYTQYMFNSMIFNPAYTGIKRGTHFNSFVRNQWAGVDGAPRTQTISVAKQLKDEKSGFGGYFINDQIGVEKNVSLFLSYAYRLTIDDEHKLSFGLAGGAGHSVFEGTKLVGYDPDDSYFPRYNQRKFYPDANAGLYLTQKDYKYYAGVSLTNLISSNDKRNNFYVNRHLYITAGVIVPVKDLVVYYPSIIVKNDMETPVQYELSNLFLIKETLWMGFSIRNSMKTWLIPGSTAKTMSLISRVAVGNYNLGYAYDVDLGSIGGVGAVHEVSLSLSLHKGIIKPTAPKCYF